MQTIGRGQRSRAVCYDDVFPSEVTVSTDLWRDERGNLEIPKILERSASSEPPAGFNGYSAGNVQPSNQKLKTKHTEPKQNYILNDGTNTLIMVRLATLNIYGSQTKRTKTKH